MKKILTLIALLLSFFASQAETVVVDGIKYSISGNTATVLYYDNSDNYVNNGQYYQGDIIIPDNIVHNEVQYNVIAIYNSAFRNCEKLSSITIPATVTEVQTDAFKGCSDLKKVIIADSESNISLLGKDNGTTGSRNGSFEGAPIEEVYIGRNITLPRNKFSICNSAFANCKKLSKVVFGTQVSEIERLFEGCPNIQSLSWPGIITEIKEYAFSGCSSLHSVGDLSNVRAIGNYAFLNCSSLDSLGSISRVTSIGNKAFMNCSSLTELIIPASVESIGTSAFSNCSGLKKLIISDSDNCLTLNGNNGDGYYYYKGSFENLPLEEIYLGRDLTCNYGKIGSYTYNGTFENSSLLTKVTIGNRTSTIEKGLFKNCYKLDSINIPASVKEIKDDAFSGDWTILKFNDTIPTTIGAPFGEHNLLVVPDSVYTDYYNAWTNYQGQILSSGYPLAYDVEVVAKQSDSDVLSKVLDGGPQSKALNVVGLKVKGSINSYDIMVMRNKMLNLRNLDLSEANIVANSYEYYTGYHSTDSVIGPYSFYNLSNLKSVKLPNSVKTISDASFAKCSNLENLVLGEENALIGNHYSNSEDYNYYYLGAFAYSNLKEVTFNEKLKSIGSYAFYSNRNLENIELSDSLKTISDNAFSGCSSLTSVKMGPNLKTIGNYAFQNCSKLNDVTFSPSLTSIGQYGFSGCSSLETIMLPTTLQSIGTYAFSGCSSLKNVRIPASITSIGNFAFNTSSITDIYTWTIEPTNINQNTFHSDLFTKTMLHVPETSNSLYYWDTQWSQFLNTSEFNEPYTYFYLSSKDLIEDEDTPRIEGEEGDNPDADINPGGALVVIGDDNQGLGDTTIGSNGSDNAGSIIGGDSSTEPSGANVNIDNLTIKIQITANKWYFFAFPFDIPLADVHFDGQFVWRYYDGEYRAVHGNNAWKTMELPMLQRGKGYIFQGSKSGTLYLRVGRAAIGGENKVIELENHASSNLQNASWNLVGNPFTSYYPISDIAYMSPITIWNGSTYAAYNPADDDVTLYPFQAFFVQKPDANTNMGFLAENRITKNQRDDQAVLARARDRRMAKSRSTVNREIVNIEVSDGNATDMTRVVFNEESLGSYELTCDASKFMSDGAPQIYTIDATNAQYSINERPMADGIVRMGFTANHSGVFTISASRLDCPMWLKDMATGAICDLSSEEYEFTSDAGTFDDRFLLINTNADPTGIADIIGDNDVDAIYYGVNGMRLNKANGNGVTIVKKGSKVEKILNK